MGRARRGVGAGRKEGDLKPLKVNDAEFYTGDCLEILPKLPEGSVQMVVTSPPYWNQRDYQTNDSREIGKESDVGGFIEAMVKVGVGLRRVLRGDGIWWLNLGDKMGEGKQVLGIPWRVAFALQKDRWILRSAMPWVKRNCLPTSAEDRPGGAVEYVFMFAKNPKYFFDMVAVRKNVPQEKVERIRREIANGVVDCKESKHAKAVGGHGATSQLEKTHADRSENRNFRDSDLWFESIETPHGLVGCGGDLLGLDVVTEGLTFEHFAAYPPALVEPLILAGTSAKGCCINCGSPWNRVVEKKREATRPGLGKVREGEQSEKTGNRDPGRHVTKVETVGWEPTCECGCEEVVPCTVLDPFAGAGTTSLAAQRLGRRSIGIELNPKNVEACRLRLLSRGRFGKQKIEKPKTGGLFEQMGLK